MKNTVSEIRNQIETYNNMIEELVNTNAPDSVIGRLELKRQRLIERIKVAKEFKTEEPKKVKEELKIDITPEYVSSIKVNTTNIDKTIIESLKQIDDEIEVEKELARRGEKIENLNEEIEIYEDIITKITVDPTRRNKEADKNAIEILKLKKKEIEVKIKKIMETDYETVTFCHDLECEKEIPSSKEVLYNINKLDDINEKLFQCRTGIRRTTKDIFKIITSPDYIHNEIPVEANDLIILKRYKNKILNEEEKALKIISRFFKAKITI